MSSKLFRKGLAVAVILLFIGLAFAPSINANISKPSLKKETVEFTTEVCGLNGGKQTVQLTKSEAEEVEILFDYIESGFNNSWSLHEMVDVYKEAVIKLDELGFLPAGFGVEQAQKLVLGPYMNPKVVDRLENIKDNNMGSADYEIMNILCFVFAKMHSGLEVYNPLLFIGVAIYLLSGLFGLEVFFYLLFLGAIYYYTFKPFFFYCVLSNEAGGGHSVYTNGLYGSRHDTKFDSFYGYKGFRIYNFGPDAEWFCYLLGHAYLMVDWV